MSPVVSCVMSPVVSCAEGEGVPREELESFLQE